ncbi:porin [Vibrio lentus]|uniref:porin n=1 Tax=Vibrio lentus TaxID=136468 RepID=UPI0007EEE64B|nr:porin [Vibrio lentus]OBT27721.1 porin [Vibrio tasmaniensis]PMG22105.1 porin [Vibrio lentus]PMH05838.1 porin [Vibrio lentus]PMI41202.1 porin [Vibrio lentus]PMI62074.1 porin [Vibrio lentus]
MKKTLLALALAGISTSTLAAGNIYDDGTTALNLKGEIDTYLSTAETKTTAAGVSTTNKSEVDVDLWAKIQIDASHKLNDSVTAFGSFEIQNGNGFDGWKGKADDDNSMQTDDLYFGFNIGENFGIAAGEIGDFGDSFDAITIDNTNEGLGYMDDFVSSLESAGHGVSLKYTTGGLKLIADTYLSSDEDEDAAYGVSAEYALNEMFTFGASYQDQGNRGLGTDHSIMGVAARLSLGDFGAAANYVTEDITGASDRDTVSVALDYQIEKVRAYTSIGATEGDADQEINYFTVGADYAVSSNLSAFAEYTDVEEKTDNNNKREADGFVAGMYFTF